PSGLLNVDLLNPAGAVVASGTAGPTNLDKIISNFTVAAGAGGTYYARVSGGGGVQYSLVATRNAALDAEANDTFATAEDFTGRRGALGFVRGGTNLFDLRGTPVTGGLTLTSSKLTLGINTDGSFINGRV